MDEYLSQLVKLDALGNFHPNTKVKSATVGNEALNCERSGFLKGRSILLPTPIRHVVDVQLRL